VAEEFTKLKEEVAKTAPQIMAAVQNNQQIPDQKSQA
jgi:hypothetical protein